MNTGESVDSQIALTFYIVCMRTKLTSYTQYTENIIIKLLLPEIIKRWNLKVNHGKTEHTILKKDTVHNNHTKKIGSMLSGNKEVT